MKLLILGGTVFLGKHLVEAARARGHELTLFNRGRSRPDAFSDVTQLHGDRATDLNLLAGQTWDAVIDTSGYIPRIVRASAEALQALAPHYTFISSISVYADTASIGIDETSAVGTLSDEAVAAATGNDKITGENYGPLKALCEAEVTRVYGDHALVIRPGLIVGPDDPTDRFTYWPHRIAQGGDVLGPGGPDWVTQVIDVRDLAEWTIRMVEAGAHGVFNATGPETPLKFGDIVQASAQAAADAAEPAPPANLVWVDEQWLLDQQVAPWSDLPLWIPTMDPSMAGFSQISIAKATTAGLMFRDIGQTIRDTLYWDRTRGDVTLRAGLTRDREAELLAKWRTK